MTRSQRKVSHGRLGDPADAIGGRKERWKPPDVFLDVNFPLALRHADPQTPDILHEHSGFWELMIVYGGEGTQYTSNEDYRIRSGDVFVLRQGECHGFKDVDELYLCNLCFIPRRILVHSAHLRRIPGYRALFALEPMCRREHPFESRLHLTPEELAHLLTLTSAIDLETIEQNAGYEFAATGWFMQAITFVCRCYLKATVPSTQSLIRMASVIDHLEANYTDSIELDELKEMAHMSASALINNFKKATGVPPIEYLLRVRVARAIELLCSGGMTVTEVASAVGFSDSNYFARQFRKFMKMTPTQYRERMRHLSTPRRFIPTPEQWFGTGTPGV